MDHYTRSITGRATGTRGRVIWRNRRLYVFTADHEPAVFAAPDRPTRLEGSTHATAGVEWVKGPCGCGFPRDLKRASKVMTDRTDEQVDAGTLTVQPLEETADA